MDENKFKKANKPPACSLAPWFDLIPENIRHDTMRKIRQETIEAYGYSMDECPKRLVCFTKKCIGRPLPWKSETAKPYLDQLKTTQNIVKDELFISGCDGCPIAKTCSKPCQQIENFMNRHYKPEPNLILKDNMENLTDKPQNDNFIPFDSSLEVPWDILDDKKKSVVKSYLFNNKDFETIAKELGFYNQSAVKYVFYSALTKMSEYGTMRKFLDSDRSNELTDKQYRILLKVYRSGKKMWEIAKEEKSTKQAIQQSIKRVIQKFSIKWQVFAIKKGNKVIYNVPQLFK